METAGQRIRAESEARGEAWGEARGEVRGSANVLTSLLEARFGVVPAEVRDTISTADAPQIVRWSLKVLDAPTIDAVINGFDAS